MLDITVISRETLDPEAAKLFEKPWLARSEEGKVFEFPTSGEAYAFQQGWRVAKGLDAKSGLQVGHYRYKPRRAWSRWLEDAPEYILAVYDLGPKHNDRYTVLFGGSLNDPLLLKDRMVLSLGFNDCPTSPNMGVSMWGEVFARDRDGLGKKIKWLDLPEHLRNHVIARATAK